MLAKRRYLCPRTGVTCVPGLYSTRQARRKFAAMISLAKTRGYTKLLLSDTALSMPL